MTTLRELGTRPRRSQAWEPGSQEIVRFFTDEGASYGFLWHVLIFGAYVLSTRLCFCSTVQGRS